MWCSKYAKIVVKFLKSSENAGKSVRTVPLALWYCTCTVLSAHVKSQMSDQLQQTEEFPNMDGYE